MITLKNISKTFRQNKQQFQALSGIDLQINEGEILGVIGSSGAGKSTLIRMVNLLEQPDTGQVLIRDKDLTILNNRQLARERKKIGMIFQHFNLLSSRTVFDNVAFPLELSKVSRNEIQKRVSELLFLVGLEDKSKEYPKNLSGGQKQRVAIARALANDPYILLCDEATSALDPATTKSILELLKEINTRLRITILLITHEMEVIKSICNQVAILDKGRLMAKGTLEELLTENKNPILKQFIHTNTMTIPQGISGELKPEHTEGLFPLIEIELNGNIPFEKLMDTIYNYYKIPYKLVKADIEYLGKLNFGKLLLHLKGTAESNEKALHYFNQNNIHNTVRGYAA